jgi:hypothetical protein
VHQRIRQFLDTGPALSRDADPFVKLLEDFLAHRTARAIASPDESNLETVVELLWFDEARCVT